MIEQRSPEWFKLRKQYVGASDAPVLMGVSPWKTPYELFIEKTSPYVEVTNQNLWMQRGIDLEPEALQAFELATGYLMSPQVLISPRNQFMMASLDGLELDGKAAVEIKVPGKKDHECAIEGQVPEKYKPQLQHQIEVTGLPMIYYMSYSPDHEKPIIILSVEREDHYIDILVTKESEFYHNHMLTGIPPANDRQIKTIDSEVWKNLTDEYKRLDCQEKEAQKRKDEIRDYLVQIAQSENARGNGILLQKVERKGIINYQNIPMLKTMNLEEFRKPSTSSWRITESNDEMA